MTNSSRAGKGILFVLSAPSGAGKTTVAEMVLPSVPDLDRSISHTTRSKRHEETDGVDYYFVDERTFKKMVDDDEFIEWANVHGAMYGTSFKTIDTALENSDRDLLLIIDVQGAEALRNKDIDSRSIFLLPPSLEELERRLTGRGTESPDKLKIRLDAAKNEMEQKEKFDYVIVNDDLDTAVKELISAINAERALR